MRVLNKALSIFFTALPLVMLCLLGGAHALYIAATIALHECAHLAALRLLGGRVKRFRAAPFGLCIDYDAGTLPLWGELLVSGAGCLVNFAVALAAVVCYSAFSVDFLLFGIVNAALALMNLLPIYPLDGHKMLNISLSLLLGPFAATRISYIFSDALGFICFLVSAYLLVTSATGVYPLLFSVYIFASNAKKRQESIEF